MGRHEMAKEDAQQLSSNPKFGRLTRNLAKEWTADLQLVVGEFDKAKATYTELRKNAFRRAIQRRLDVKLIASESPEIAQSIVQFLSFSRTRERATHQIETLYRKSPRNLMVVYLRARHLLSRNQPIVGARQLATIQTQISQTSLKLEIERLLAATSFNQHCYEQASKRYGALVERFGNALTAGEREHFSTWSKRSQFFAQSSRLKGLSCPLEIDNLGKPPHDGDNWE